MPQPSVVRLASAAVVLVAVAACAAEGPAKQAAPAVVLVAGEQPPKDHVRPSVFLSVDRLPGGGTAKVAVVLDVEAGWHINANPPRPDFLVPTTVAIKSEHGTKLAKLDYPKGTDVPVEGFDVPLSVYGGKVVLVGQLEVPREAAGKTEELKVEVKFQACNDAQCLPPKTAKLAGKIPVAAAGEPVKAINEDLFAPKKR